MKNAFVLTLFVILCSFSYCPSSLSSTTWKGVDSQKQNNIRGHLENREFADPHDSYLKITMPISRIVYQRNNNKAIIQIKGKCSENATSIEARLVARALGQGITTKWVSVDAAPSNGAFSGMMNAQEGWYNLEVRAIAGKSVAASNVVERVGIGEVFIVVGHSVAHGGEINLEGATDDRVNTVSHDEHLESFSTYLETGDPQYLPAPVFVHASTGVAPAPFAHGPYFWSKFGEKIAQEENVPVLIYNAAFGGTSLEHWAKSSQNIQFEHGFVKSEIRMPYINLLNTFKKYIPLTGLRALLADQGQNDWQEKDEEKVFKNYQTFIKQAREDLNYPELALVVNRQTPKSSPIIRHVQDRMVKEPNSFPGPDYDTLAEEDRTDGIHLSRAGMAKAAEMWAAALTPEFFKRSQPYIPSWK